MPELPTCDRQGDRTQTNQCRRGQALKSQESVNERGQEQQRHSDEESCAIRQRQDFALYLADVSGIGRDTSRRGRLDAELDDTDDEQHGEQGCGARRSPEGRAPAPRCGEGVGGEVHDPHRDGDGSATMADARRALGGCHRASLILFSGPSGSEVPSRARAQVRARDASRCRTWPQPSPATFGPPAGSCRPCTR